MTQPQTPKDILKRYPRLTAHLICESLGYATPTLAAGIILAAIKGQPHYCEWIYSCYNTQPRPAIQSAIHNRHHHRGYMAHYPHALQLVQHAITTGREPELASWF
jgi:hypothetical protein